MTLLKIEWRKLSQSGVFWVMLSLSLLTLIIGFNIMESTTIFLNSGFQQQGYQGESLLPENVFTFPDIWHNITYTARFFKILLAVVMIVLVANEYSFNTFRQNLLSGLSRKALIGSKIIDALILSLIASLIVLAFGLFAGFGSGVEFQIADVFAKMNYLPAYFLMLLSFLSFAMLLTLVVKRTALSIILLLIYSYIFEPLVSWRFADSFGDFLPLKSINHLIESPNTQLYEMMTQSAMPVGISATNVVVVIAYTCLFWAASYWVISKRDL